MFEDINGTIHDSISNNSSENVMTRLATLTQALSEKNANDMELFQFNQDDFELEKVLKFLVDFNRSNGYNENQIDVVFKDLTVIAKNTTASTLKDFSDVFLKPFVLIYDRINRKKNTVNFKELPKTRKIIRDVTGFASPGTITLVLGRPGAGCSTFLKTVAGQTDSYINIEGDILFNGIHHKEMFKYLQNLLIYNPELDTHFPHLTVEQTLKFAISCKTPTIRYDNKSRDEYIENMKNLYEILFGLKFVEKTLVGNDFVRGISGGQRKRVSIAEAMVTGGSVYCFDNATRGLDSSTALEFAQALRTSTNVYKTSTLITIYQAAENIYELFDNVTVLYLGRQIYFGPCNEAVQYFQNMGFVKEPRQTSSEFLTAITDPLARKIDPNFKDKDSIPQNADEFEFVWKHSMEYAKLQKVIDEKLLNSTNASSELENLKQNHSLLKQKYTSYKSHYTVNYFTQLKACCKRRFQITLNDRAFAISMIFAAVFQSFVMGSAAYQSPTDTSGAFIRGGIIFFSCLYFALMTLAGVPSLYLDKQVLNKQRAYKLYHPSAEALAKQIAQFPVNLLGVTFFTIIIYFLPGLKKEAGPFFQYYLFVILAVQAMNSLFFLFATILPTSAAAMGISGITLAATVLYSSYMIQRPSMYWWFKWFSCCNPILYSFEAMILMQFHNLRMPCSSKQLIPSGASYSDIDTTVNQVCGFVGAAASKVLYDGENDVKGDIYLELAFTYTFNHVWRNMGIMFAFIVGYISLTCFITEIFNPVPATSDQLLFIKNAKLSKSMFENFKMITAESGVSIDLEKNEDGIDISSSNDNSYENYPYTLGSNDVFTWKNVTLTIPYESEERKLLEDVQGYVLPGTLTALMGESGAGKTTLLNVLSRRMDVGVITGSMLVNGKEVSASFERRTGYVQQQDLHIPQLTVKESLMFSARLRRPRSVSEEEKLEYVEFIMKLLQMEDYADSIAGYTGYGLNVEQRKKLSIATELVAKPSLLLFLDEPTSGLDSQSSWAIVQVLRDLTKAGQAILCTIHQPSATLFEQFDRLLLLKKGGQTVYFGDIGSNSKTVLNYFENNGARKCLPDENSAEYLLEVIGAGATASVDCDWFEIWKNSEESFKVSKTIDQLNEEGMKRTNDDALPEGELDFTYATSYSYQLYQVLNRTFIQLYRTLPLLVPKFMTTLFGGLLAGFSFWNVKHTIIGMQNVMFANFLAFIISSASMNQIQTHAIVARELYEVRESKSNIFHWSCLLISQYVNEIPYCILFSTFYFIVWYFPIQLDNSAHVAGFWWFTYCFFFQLYYPSLALLVLYPAPNLPSANILLGLIFSFLISFCGAVQRPQQMPGFWRFMWRSSPMTYFMGNQLGVILHDRPVTCATEEFNYLQPPSGSTCSEYLEEYFKENTGYVDNPDATSDCAVCEYSVGDDYLHSIGVNYGDRWRNVGLFCAFIFFNLVLMNFLYYMIRVRKVFSKRGKKPVP